MNHLNTISEQLIFLSNKVYTVYFNTVSYMHDAAHYLLIYDNKITFVILVI